MENMWKEYRKNEESWTQFIFNKNEAGFEDLEKISYGKNAEIELRKIFSKENKDWVHDSGYLKHRVCIQNTWS